MSWEWGQKLVDEEEQEQKQEQKQEQEQEALFVIVLVKYKNNTTQIWFAFHPSLATSYTTGINLTQKRLTWKDSLV